MLLREISECSRNVPRDLLYLEFGLIPISYLIKMRRLMILHHILHQDEESLLFRFFLAQLCNPTKGDWVTEVMNDIEDWDLNIELEDIKNTSKGMFRKLVKQNMKDKAFGSLLKKKEAINLEHAKGKGLSYIKLKMAGYLSPSEVDMSISEKKWLMKCRIEDIDISCNLRWKQENTMCRNCISTEMSQQHLLQCKYLLGKCKIVTHIPEYIDIYKEDIEAQIYISRILKENYIRMKHQEDQVKMVDTC